MPTGHRRRGGDGGHRVLTSLYPVVPVVAGIAVLHEPVTRRLPVGLRLAALTVVLISV
ncbi:MULTISPECIES: hypothetical protein [unclassified Kribbella]|uniref:hypothetical protein n=1 Tax=unclassified Kribbella TaxID=2644121 RepID=UPI003016E42A